MPPALPNGNFAFVGPLRTKKQRGGEKNFEQKRHPSFCSVCFGRKSEERNIKISDTKKDTR